MYYIYSAREEKNEPESSKKARSQEYVRKKRPRVSGQHNVLLKGRPVASRGKDSASWWVTERKDFGGK